MKQKQIGINWELIITDEYRSPQKKTADAAFGESCKMCE